MATAQLSNQEKLLVGLKLILEQSKNQRIDDALIIKILNAFSISAHTQEVISAASMGFSEEALTKFLVGKRLAGKSAHEISAAICKHFNS